MTLNIGLIVLGLASLTYLIYRYGRFSPWRSTIIGKSFMMMKVALWAMFTFVVLRRFFPDWSGAELLATTLLMFVDAAIFWQTSVVVKLQGGVWRHEETSTGTESEGRRVV